MGGPGSGRRPSGRKFRKMTTENIKEMNHVVRRIKRETSHHGGFGGRIGKGVGMMKKTRADLHTLLSNKRRK